MTARKFSASDSDVLNGLSYLNDLNNLLAAAPRHGFQPLALISSLAFFTKLRWKMSGTLMSR